MEGPFDQDNERVLPTQPGSSLEPPRRVPPVAVGAATPDEQPLHGKPHARTGQIQLSDIPKLLTAGLQRAVRSAARALAER
jgi:hypothetical protein